MTPEEKRAVRADADSASTEELEAAEEILDELLPTAIVKYDRAPLERHEVQPISTQDGHTIVVDSGGRFRAQVGHVEISETTMQRVREKIHETHLLQERRRKKKTFKAVPCFVYVPNGFVGRGWFRGVHAGNGNFLVTAPDGSKFDSDRAVFFPLSGEVEGLGGPEEFERLVELIDREAELRAELKTIVDELSPIVRSQKDAQEKLYKERHRYGSTYVRNNQEKANDLSDSVLAVLRPESAKEEGR